MSFTIDIDRLSIVLHGVSAGVAEAAVAGLDEELRRRLGIFQVRDLVLQDFGVFVLGSVESTTTLNAATLRGLIAERLAQALLRSSYEAPAPDGGLE